MLDILDQLSSVYSQPTPAILEQNNAAFHSPYLAANAPKVLLRCIKDCTKIALLRRNPYTDRQLITSAIRLLLTTGMYLHPFEEWDCMAPEDQTWIVLCTLIQEAFQCCLNATAPIAGHHGYTPAMPHQQNAFGRLVKADSDDNTKDTVAMQVTA
jgi:hypothetical protein